ncbi:MAG: MG_279/MG_280 family protein [Malacoplasma sp.]|nr:MG_279/MG_280 family protein [Malacoplasma sp.]MDE6646095.1 MG_279/MG_280 family protein [Malacoplasma sp.]MDE6894029.1 MG_279/MG_280 family protein [Malacoplasma sp.]MDE7075020.1 MG_279/MG_280 family protein [Malacoplasma sp.]
MKLRIGLIIKNLGLWPIYGIGALFCAGLLGGGAYAVDQKSFIKQQVSNVADIVKNAKDNLTTANDNIDFAFNSAENAQTQINITIDNFTSLKQKLDEVNKSSSQSPDTNTKQEIEKISKEIDEMVSTLQGIEIPNRDSISGVEDLIGPNGSVTSILNSVNDWLANNNDDNSPLWTYYDLVSKILLSIGAVLVGLFVLGYILLIIFNKRVDGTWVSRKNIKKQLALHIKKLMKKYPELSKHLMQKYGI